MSGWNHSPSTAGMTGREFDIVNRLHYPVDRPLDPFAPPVVVEGSGKEAGPR
jgi:hypothetical protein